MVMAVVDDTSSRVGRTVRKGMDDATRRFTAGRVRKKEGLMV